MEIKIVSSKGENIFRVIRGAKYFITETEKKNSGLLNAIL